MHSLHFLPTLAEAKELDGMHYYRSMFIKLGLHMDLLGILIH